MTIRCHGLVVQAKGLCVTDDVIEVGGYILSGNVEHRAELPPSVEVVDSSGVMSSEGRYVTPDEAFRAYSVQPDRSLRKLADLLGIPRGTILGWSSRYGWSAKIKEMDQERVEGVTETISVILVQQQVKNLETLINIRDAPTSKIRERMDAAKALSGMFERYQDRALLAALTTGNNEDFLEDSKLEELAQTQEGVRQLLAHLREAG